MSIFDVGTQASRWTDTLPPGVRAIITDESSVIEALHESVRRKWAGEPFSVGLALRDSRSERAALLGNHIVSNLATFDERRAAWDQIVNDRLSINGQPAASIRFVDDRTLRYLEMTIRLGEAILVRSDAERVRLTAQFPCALAKRFVTLAVPDPSVPRVTRAPYAQTVVIWAPFRHAHEVALIDVALHDLHAPRLFVCREGSISGSLARFVLAREGAEALRNAAVIVDAELYDPGTALALAEVGAPLATANSTGAHEWVEPVAVYDPIDRTSIFSAVSRAFGAPQPSRIDPQAEQRRVMRATAVTTAPRYDGPLVTVVVPTYNRRHLLPTSLASIERQTYRDVEIVVANDGGEPVDDIVARFPRARLLNVGREHLRDRGEGGGPAMNAAIEASRGKYLVFMADDDIILPDHVMLLTAALERSGKALAHGDVLSVYLEPSAKAGDFQLIGYDIPMIRTVDPSDLLVQNCLGILSLQVRRDVFLSVGAFNRAIPYTQDYEAWVRVARVSDFVHVPEITSLYGIRSDGSNVMSYNSDLEIVGYQKTYALNPVPGRPLLEARRRQWLEHVRANVASDRPEFPLAPIPWPVWLDPTSIMDGAAAQS